MNFARPALGDFAVGPAGETEPALPSAFVPVQPVPLVAVTVVAVFTDGVVMTLPFASSRATVTFSVATPSAVFGDVLPVTTSLFGAPVMTVVRVADAEVTVELLASVAVHEHVPGVVVEVMVKLAVPLLAVPVAVAAPASLQMFAPEVSVIVIESALDGMIVPLASVTSTSRVEMLVPSAEIVAGENDAASFAAAPGAVTGNVAEQPVSVPDEIETTAVPAVVRAV